MPGVLQDLLHGVRSLRRDPVFTLVAVLSLALGVGANTVTFSFYNGMFVRPIPAAAPGQLVALFGHRDNIGYSSISYPDLRDLAAERGVFQGLLGSSGYPVSMGVAGASAEMRWSERVTPNYFDLLGLEPAAGRLFRPGVDDYDAVVVLSWSLWQARFAGDRGVVGRTVTLNGRPATVIGVAPRGFMGTRLFTYLPELWVPLPGYLLLWQGNTEVLDNRDAEFLTVIARLQPGVSLEQTRAAARTVATRLAEQYPATKRELTLRVFTSKAAVNPWGFEPEAGRRTGILAMVAVGLVLLIACANVASLLLARATARGREVAVRLAMGASRARLVRQLLTENLALALVGGAAGYALALWGNSAAASLEPSLEFASAFDPSPDGRVLVFALVASVATTLLFGLVPAWHATRTAPAQVLRDDTRASGRLGLSLREVLVVGQVTLALVLLVAAGLFARGLRSAASRHLGYDLETGVRMSLDVGVLGYTPAQSDDFYRRLLERVRGLGEVVAVTHAFPVPLDGNGWSREVAVQGRADGREAEHSEILVSIIGPDYFETMGTRLRRGRDFGPGDSAGAPRVAIVNETFARRFWPDRDPIGGRLRLGMEGTPVEVVGVAEDGKYLALTEEPRPYFFLPYHQERGGRQTLIVRAARVPVGLTAALREQVRATDPAAPVFGEMTMRQHRELALSLPQTGAWTAGSFGLLALLLSASGIYGVIAYAVARRTREIGIRVALGARPGQVLALVVRRGALLAGCGIALGLAIALGTARLLQSILFGVSAFDPVTLGGIAAGLGAVALLASWLPARRAARIDPMEALRAE